MMGKRKLSDEVVSAARQAVKNGEKSVQQLMAELSMVRSSVNSLLLGKSYAHVPDPVSVLPSTSFSDETVIASRLAFKKGEKTTEQLESELGITRGAVRDLLTGKTYKQVAEALPRLRAADISDKQVRAIRNRYRKYGGHLAVLGRKHGMTGRNFESLLLGNGSFSNIPGALTADEIAPPVRFDKDTVLALRQRYEAAKGRIALDHLAAELKTKRRTIQKMLKGEKPYDRYKGFEAEEVLSNAAYFRVREVQEMRHFYRVNLGKVTLFEMADKYNSHPQMIRKALLGHGPFAKIPNPVERIVAGVERSLEPEVVLFMRLVYQNGNVTQQQLAEAHGLSKGYIQQCLSGNHYGFVPEAVSAKGKFRLLTDEQVIWARRMYATGQVTMRTLEKELGIDNQAMGAMLRGMTYKDIPGAVPDRIKFRRRGSSSKPRPFLHWEPEDISVAKAALDEIIARAGNRQRLAAMLGVKHDSAIFQWARRGYVSEPMVATVSRVMGIEPQRLRPDLCRDKESGLHIAIVDPKRAAEMDRLMPGGHRIMNEIVDEYGLTVEDLLREGGRHDPNQGARRHMWYRIRTELGYSFRKIANLCNRNVKTIERSVARFASEVETPSAGVVGSVDGERPFPLVFNAGSEL
jgi:transposase